MQAISNTHASVDAGNAAFLAHMNTLQGIVTRLAGACASCKTWCLGLVTALLGIAGSTHMPGLLRAALVPVAIFAFLDINYLSHERWFRHLYAEMAKKAQEGKCTTEHLFDFPARKSGRAWADRLRSAISFSVWPVYLGLALACWFGPCWLAQPLPPGQG